MMLGNLHLMVSCSWYTGSMHAHCYGAVLYIWFLFRFQWHSLSTPTSITGAGVLGSFRGDDVALDLEVEVARYIGRCFESSFIAACRCSYRYCRCYIRRHSLDHFFFLLLFLVFIVILFLIFV